MVCLVLRSLLVSRFFNNIWQYMGGELTSAVTLLYLMFIIYSPIPTAAEKKI